MALASSGKSTEKRIENLEATELHRRGDQPELPPREAVLRSALRISAVRLKR